MNRSTTALAALGAGILAGALVRAADSTALTSLAQAAEPIGTLWLNALRMTLVPLVFAMVAQGMISLDRSGGKGGRLLGVTLPLLVGLLFLAMAIGMGFGLLFDLLWPVTRGAMATLSQSPAPIAPDKVPSMIDLIVGLVPTNPVSAAANGTMASVVIFALAFGFAVSRTSEPGDEPVARAIRGLAAAMIQLVHWVLWFAPLGIFMLSLGLALHTGLAVAGFIAQMVLATIGAALLAILLGYVLAWIGGRIDPPRFARAIVGPQVMSAGTCSSAATLPAMIEASERELGISPAIGGAVLPLAVSLFRFAVPMYQGAVVILLLYATGLPLDPGKLVIGGAILVITNLGVAGLPGAAVIYVSWSAGLQVLGLPLEIIPLMIAANALPDVFVTVGNVTMDMAVATVVSRSLGDNVEPVPALAPAA